MYSHYYTTGATRIDTSFHWGQIIPKEVVYLSVPLSDHMGLVVTIEVPTSFNKLLCPKSRPLFKIRPEVVFNPCFKMSLKENMTKWNEVRKHCSTVMSWWEHCVKPNIKRLAIKSSKEINKKRRARLNLLFLRQLHLTSRLQSGERQVLPELRSVQLEICQWYDEEAEKIKNQSKIEDFQTSEKIRIHHHEFHKKKIRNLNILTLMTEKGMLQGHE